MASKKLVSQNPLFVKLSFCPQLSLGRKKDRDKKRLSTRSVCEMVAMGNHSINLAGQESFQVCTLYRRSQ